MRGRAVLILALLFGVALAVAASATLRLRQDAAITPSAKAPPITLGAGTAGSTALGSSLTSATTTGATLPVIGSAQVLKLVHGDSTYTARVEIVSVSGAGVLDSMTLSIVGPTTQAQVIVTLGSVTQSTGTAVSVPSAGPDPTIIAAGGCLGSCLFTLRIILVPSGGGPVLSYPYSLTVT